MSSVAGNHIGIDYHDKTVRVCVMSVFGEVLANRSCSNDVLEVSKLVNRYGKVKRVVAEACNGSTEFLEELSRSTGWEKRLCHPGYVHRMKHNPDKSDKTDSELIADLDRVEYLPQVWFAPLEIRDLRCLVRYRSQQLERQRKAKLRLRSVLRQYRLRWQGGQGLWTKSGLSWLSNLDLLPENTLWVFRSHIAELCQAKEELKRTEARLKTFSQADPLTKRLMTRRGIGLIVATALRAEVGEFSRFRTGKQLSRFCGVSPCNASSGSRQADAGLIRAGAPLLKTAIIEAAHRLVRYDAPWREFAKRLIDAGKPYPVVIAAVANRWLRRLFWELRSENNLLASTSLESSLG